MGYSVIMSGELRHYGVKGQERGVRNYQNEDGSYKPGAEGRYSSSSTSNGKSVSGGGSGSSSSKKSISDIAKEVRNGKWGNGSERKKRLTEAGYNYDEVQKEVNRIVNGGSRSSGSSSEEKKEEEKKQREFDFSQTQSDWDNILKTIRSKTSDNVRTDDNSMKYYCEKAGVDWNTLDDKSKKYFKDWADNYNKYGTSAERIASSLNEEFDGEDFDSMYPAEDYDSDEDRVAVAMAEFLGLSFDAYDSKSKQAIVDRLTKNVSHSDILEHHGIKGQKWGIRRYQNEDGTYTTEGKRRRRSDDYDPDYKSAHDKTNVKYLSDKELQRRVNRLNNERVYKTKNPTVVNQTKNAANKAKTALLTTSTLATTALTLWASSDKLKEKLSSSPIVKKLLKRTVSGLPEGATKEGKSFIEGNRAKTKYEKNKEKIIDSGNAKKILKNRKYMSDEEFDRAYKNAKQVSDLNGMANKNRSMLSEAGREMGKTAIKTVAKAAVAFGAYEFLSKTDAGKKMVNKGKEYTKELLKKVGKATAKTTVNVAKDAAKATTKVASEAVKKTADVTKNNAKIAVKAYPEAAKILLKRATQTIKKR